MSLWRKFVTFAAVLGAMVIGGGFASADITTDDSDTATVTFSSLNTRTIAVGTESIDFGQVAATDAAIESQNGGDLTYSTSATGDTIDVSAANLPESGATLSLTVDDPVGTGAGALFNDDPTSYTVTLSSTPGTVIDGISETTDATAGLTYDLVTSGLASADYSVTVTYTIAAG